MPSPLDVAQSGLRKARRGLGAEQDLTRVGDALHQRHAARRRAGHDELGVRPADTEHVDVARVDADRHAQRDPADRRLVLRRAPQCGTHLDRCRGGVERVIVAGVVEQQRVAPELGQ